MAVFLAASDETSGANAFALYHYAGWIAPVPDWWHYFTPVWYERVLEGPPRIPFLHMTDIRSRAWREKWKLSQLDADDRLDDAALVIDQLGSLYPLKLTIDASIFRPLYKSHKMIAESGKVVAYEPDFFAFMTYAFTVLLYVKEKCPDAERVDFLVENNSEITKHIYHLYKALPESLKLIGKPELVPLVGDFIPAGKDRVPLQAADYLCWHSQRAEAGTLDEKDARRWHTISMRSGFDYLVPTDLLKELADAFDKAEGNDGEIKTVRSVRQNHARPDERIARRNKKGTGRRKGSKNAKKTEG